MNTEHEHCLAYRLVWSTIVHHRSSVKKRENIPSAEHGIGTVGPVGWSNCLTDVGVRVQVHCTFEGLVKDKSL